MLLLLHARRPAAHSRKYSIHRKSNTRCADEAGASSTASGGSVTERAKYLAAPPLERVAAGKPSSQSIQNNTLGFGSGVRTSNRVRPSSEKAETSFCQILSLAMTNRLIFVCSLFATSTARGFSEFPLAFLPNFRYLPAYR